MINSLVQHSRRWAVAIVAVNLLAALWLAALPGTFAPGTTETATVQRPLVLLSETDTVPRVCYAWGPFSDADALDPLQDEIKALGAMAHVASREIKGKSDYLVYIGPEASRDAMRRIRRELDALDIESYMIVQGPYANRVSVGVFSRQTLALAQRDRVKALGYDVDIEELARSHEVHHLIAEVGADFAASVPPTGFCEDIAPREQFL